MSFQQGMLSLWFFDTKCKIFILKRTLSETSPQKMCDSEIPINFKHFFISENAHLVIVFHDTHMFCDCSF